MEANIGTQVYATHAPSISWIVSGKLHRHLTRRVFWQIQSQLYFEIDSELALQMHEHMAKEVAHAR